MVRARVWLGRLPLADRVVVGLAVIVLVLFAVSTEDQPVAGDPRAFDGWAVALLATAFGLLLFRRRFPGTVVLAVVLVSIAWYFSGYTNSIINAPIMVAYYNLGTTGDRRRQIGVGLATVAIPVIGILFFAHKPAAEAADAVGYPIAAILFGEIVRNRRILMDELAEKAARAEADREAEAERRVAEERLRIARDVHDVLAHAVAVMTVQAGLAADAQERDPATARAALATIRSAGKEAMAEMRATVAVLRGSGRAEIAPAPQLGGLGELVDGARAEGLDVGLCTEGLNGLDGLNGLEGVDGLIQLTTYRIVQESLTNVLRHAEASQATVRVERRQPGEMLIEVIDNGRPPVGRRFASASPVGFGLRGMRERVESLGGTLRFGRRPAGGWEVVARLPIGSTKQ